MFIEEVSSRSNIILKYVRVFQLFCIAPYKKDSASNETSYTLNRISTAIISLILTVY